MIPENFKILVDKLIKKTTKKEAIWYKTSRDNQFKLDLGKGAITVDRWENEMMDGEMVDIAVINEYGDIVDSICFSSFQEEYKYLVDFHSLVLQTTYKVEETFKTIFQELDSDKVIGIGRNVEDLPFM